MEKKKYSGFICLKCNSIPFFQLIYKKNEIKIFSACNCHKQYESIDSFFRNKYIMDKIDIDQIYNQSFSFSADNNQTKEKDQLDMKNILKDFIQSKEKMNETANKIKNEIISLYNKKIKEFNEIYDKYISSNNKIILVIEKLIDSYQIIKDNPSIIENIKNNCIFNNKYDINNLLREFNSSIESSFNRIKTYFDKELIIRENIKSPIYKKIESRYYPNSNDYIISFIELENDICASCSEKDNDIVIYDLKNEIKEKIIFKAHLKNIYSMIKSYKNNIISIGDDGFIKIWPLITRNFLFESKNKFDIENKNKIRSYSNIVYKKIEIKINPLFKFDFYYKEQMKIEKMINLKNECFLTSSQTLIALYKYEISNNYFQIKKINDYEHDIKDVYIIEINQKEVISLCSCDYINFLYLQDFKFINKINVKISLISKNCLLQLNSQEVLIIDNLFYLNIYNLNNFVLKLRIRNYNDIDSLLNLNDGTFIVGCFEGIKRYLIKTMEELPQLIKFNSNFFYEDYDYYDYDYECNREAITFLYKLKNERIVACYKDGTIEILNIEF